MDITTLEYTRRRPLEQYGHEEMKAVAQLGEGENALMAAIQLKEFIHRALDGKEAEPEDAPMFVEEGDPAPAEAPKEETKKRGRKPKEKAPEVAEELPGKVLDPVPDEPEPEAKTIEEEKQEKAAKAKEAAPKRRKAGSPYDRNNEIHKKMFSELLNKYYPDWRQTPGKAKDASLDLEGQEYLTETGEIVPGFVEKLKERMG